MRNLLPGVGMGLLALALTVGCSSSQTNGDAGQEGEEEVGAPLVLEEDTSTGTGAIAVPGLTPSTQSSEITVDGGFEPGKARGVIDPFTLFPVAATSPPPEVEDPEPVSQTDASPEEVSLVASVANDIRVSGVVQVGGVVRVILQAPGEPSSRYVRAGQYVADGQVLVKRIDIGSSTPEVVFEENGIEVLKPVESVGGSEEGTFEGASVSPATFSPANISLVPPPPPLGAY